MWRGSSLGVALGLALALAALVASRPVEARAQACCTGGGALTPWRLEHHESGLVGLVTRVTPVVGDFDPQGAYHAIPKGTREVEAEARLMGSVRVHERVQIGLQVPLLLVHRVAGGVDATRVGLGDVALGARWDPLFPGELGGLPGVALEIGVVAPTGTAPEDADAPLAVDATGLGTWQLGVGAGVEHVFGADRQWLVSLRGGMRWRAPRTIAGVETQRDLEGTLSLGGALVLPGATLAAALDVVWEGGDTFAGVSTAQHLMTLGLVLAVPLDEAWRALASIRSPLPIDGLGQNRPLGVDLGLTLVYAGF